MNLFRFGRLWSDALETPVTDDSILGPWAGEWESDGGHRGALRGVVLSVDAEQLHVAFHAVYWKIFRVTYAPRLQGSRSAEGFDLDGNWKLGPISGLFRYDGRVTPARFHAEYRSRSDHGTFEMHRPE